MNVKKDPRKSRSPLIIAVASIVFMTLIAACGAQKSDDDSTVGARTAQSRTAPNLLAQRATKLLTSLKRSDGGAELFTPATLTSALPSTTYFDGRARIHVSTLAATGSFGSWSPGDSRLDSNQPNAGEISPVWRVVNVEFLVDQVIVSSKEATAVAHGTRVPVQFYLPPDTNASDFAEGLQNLGPCVALLTGGFPGTSDWEISQGALLGKLADDHNKFSMVIDATEDPSETSVDGIVVDATSVSELRTASQIERTVNVGPAATTSAGITTPEPAPTSQTPSAPTPGTGASPTAAPSHS